MTLLQVSKCKFVLFGISLGWDWLIPIFSFINDLLCEYLILGLKILHEIFSVALNFLEVREEKYSLFIILYQMLLITNWSIYISFTYLNTFVVI